jgi:hypothetical protein
MLFQYKFTVKSAICQGIWELFLSKSRRKSPSLTFCVHRGHLCIKPGNTAKKISALRFVRGSLFLESFVSILQRFINSFIHFVVWPDVFVFRIFAFISDFGLISPRPFLCFLFTIFFRGIRHFLIAQHLDPWPLHKFFHSFPLRVLKYIFDTFAEIVGCRNIPAVNRDFMDDGKYSENSR